MADLTWDDLLKRIGPQSEATSTGILGDQVGSVMDQAADQFRPNLSSELPKSQMQKLLDLRAQLPETAASKLEQTATKVIPEASGYSKVFEPVLKNEELFNKVAPQSGKSAAESASVFQDATEPMTGVKDIARPASIDATELMAKGAPEAEGFLSKLMGLGSKAMPYLGKATRFLGEAAPYAELLRSEDAGAGSDVPIETMPIKGMDNGAVASNLNVPFKRLPGDGQPVEAPKEIMGPPAELASPQPVLADRSPAVVGKAEAAPVAAPAPEAPAASPEQDPMDQLKMAQAAANQNQFGANLLKAGLQAGAAIGSKNTSTPIQANMDVANSLEKQANQPVEDVLNRTKMKGTLTEQKLKGLQLKNETDLNDPKSDVSTVYRGAMKKLGFNMSENSTAASMKNAFPAIEKMVAHMEHNDVMKLKREEMKNDKDNKYAEKTLDAYAKAIDFPKTSSRGPEGKAANTIRSAEALELLAAGTDPKNLTSEQISELARGLDSMLSAGQASVTGAKKLDPNMLSRDKAKIMAYLKGEPQGAGVPKLVTQYMHTIQREKDKAQEQLVEYMLPRITKAAPLAQNKQHGPTFEALTQQSLANLGLSPEQRQNIIDQVKNGKTIEKGAILGKKPAHEVPNAKQLTPDGRVTVKAPDGTIGHIPKEQLKDALSQGYTEVNN